MVRNGISNAHEQSSLWRIAVECASTYGIASGTAIGLKTAGASGAVTVGALTIPGFVAGFLAGAAGATTGCMIAEGPVRREIKRLAERARLSGL